MKFPIFVASFATGCALLQQSSPTTTPESANSTRPLKVDSKKQSTAPSAKPVASPVPKGGTDPQFLKGLPKWEDIKAPADMPNPTAGLGLVLETNTCFKEFFGDRTVHPHVRKYGGRVLSQSERPMGRMIVCPEEKKAEVLAELKKAGAL